METTRRPTARVLTAAHLLSLATVTIGVLYLLASPVVLLYGMGSAMTAGGNPWTVGELLGWLVVPAVLAALSIGFSIRARMIQPRFGPAEIAMERGGWTARSLLLAILGTVLMALPWAGMLAVFLNDGLR